MNIRHPPRVTKMPLLEPIGHILFAAPFAFELARIEVVVHEVENLLCFIRGRLSFFKNLRKVSHGTGAFLWPLVAEAVAKGRAEALVAQLGLYVPIAASPGIDLLLMYPLFFLSLRIGVICPFLSPLPFAGRASGGRRAAFPVLCAFAAPPLRAATPALCAFAAFPRRAALPVLCAFATPVLAFGVRALAGVWEEAYALALAIGGRTGSPHGPTDAGLGAK